jgi:23S rRNA (guanosine2251-2'-O)-methyltransferase
MITQKDIICGTRPVLEVLQKKSRSVLGLFLEEGKTSENIARIAKLAKRQHIKIIRKESRDLSQLSGNNIHQGVVAFVEPLSVLTLHQAIAADKNKKSLWLAVDEITDPQNFGSMVRSAVCFGVEFVILPRHRTVRITPSVYKSACGAMENINIVGVSNLNWAILTLREKGYWIYGSDTKGTALNEISYNLPAVLIIGAEDKGLRHQTRRHCDEVVSILQSAKIQSLNAACAASVILHDMYSKIKGLK